MSLILARRSLTGTFAELEDSQKFLDHCCWGPLYTGYFTSGCPEYLAANRDRFGNYEPCAYAASSDRAAGITPAQIAANDTNAGGHLTVESRAEATRLAQEMMAADIASHPERYGDLCPDGQVPQPDGICRPCPEGQVVSREAFGYGSSRGVCVTPFDWGIVIKGALIVGALIGAGFLIKAVRG